jgi:hypothetical protein
MRLPELQNPFSKGDIHPQSMANGQKNFLPSVCNINPYTAACYQHIFSITCIKKLD